MRVIVRVGRAGNGTPCFLASGQSEHLKRPFGAAFDQSRQLWMYPAFFPAAWKVLDDFKKLPITMELSERAREHVAQLEQVVSFYNRNFLPEKFTFVTKPYDHQIIGLVHLFYMYRAALFYAPGLGKSKIAIDYIRLLKMIGSFGGALVLGPLVTIQNWGNEIDLHSGGELQWRALVGTPKKKEELLGGIGDAAPDILLVTYDTAARWVAEIFEAFRYNVAIADESHLIKDWTSKRTKAAFELGQKAIRKVIMTGTPTLGSPMDIYGQFRFLGEMFIPADSYRAYKNRFCVPHPSNEHAVIGYKNLDIINDATQFISIRRSKEECLDLPERLPPIDVEFTLTRKQTVVYNQLVDKMGLDVAQLIEALGQHGALPPAFDLPNIAVMLNKLSQVSSGFLLTPTEDLAICNTCDHLRHCVEAKIAPYTARCFVVKRRPEPELTVFEENPKLDALFELLNILLGDPTNKAIVWCKYLVELQLVEERLKTSPFGYVRVDGSTGMKIQSLADRFDQDADVRVYLAQISTGVGITLNAANYTLYFSLDYSLGSYDQSKDRNYRIGQTRKVSIYRLLGKQTIDHSIAALLENKVDIDAVLTHRLSCIVCEKSRVCIPAGVQLFDATCLYQKNMARVVTRARLIGKGDSV